MCVDGEYIWCNIGSLMKLFVTCFSTNLWDDGLREKKLLKTSSSSGGNYSWIVADATIDSFRYVLSLLRPLLCKKLSLINLKCQFIVMFPGSKSVTAGSKSISVEKGFMCTSIDLLSSSWPYDTHQKDLYLYLILSCVV